MIHEFLVSRESDNFFVASCDHYRRVVLFRMISIG